MLGLGIPEMLLILVIALLLFGADKLPGIARSLGKAVREFKKEMHPSAESEEKAQDK